MLTAVILASVLARASEPDAGARARLHEATARYLQGAPAEARVLLQAVLADGPSLPADVRQEALATLGDILFSEQGPEASRGVFLALLREAPAYRLDPFVHPPAVCAQVEQIRAELAAAATPPPVAAATPSPAPPFPWAALVPGGAHAFASGRIAQGATIAAVQTAGLVVSVWTHAAIGTAFNDQPDDKDSVVRTIWLNRVSATAAWLAWGVPLAIETVAWRERRNAAREAPDAPGEALRRGAGPPPPQEPSPEP
ncbi:MAG: hypothetical protein RLZZ299_2740 [Pseudomonadota bacterium]|jgi:hypothetical protein